MSLDRTIIPEDSFLNYWMDRWSNSEVYPSWTMLTGLAIVGCLLGRKVCFDAGEVGKIYPNTSILLVGPSGHGKDTIINPACDLIRFCGGSWVRGRTMEAVKESLLQLGDPAVGFINASELSEFLGCKDYQAGMVQALTDILSNKDEIDISLKSDTSKGEHASRSIYRPTLTMFAGSTADWLQGMLPDGSLDGGFIPRFVVAAEWSKRAEGIRPIANPGRYESIAHERKVTHGKITFTEELQKITEYFRELPDEYTPWKFFETTGIDDAEGWYENWYANRYRTFSPLLQAYAHRSSGILRRLGLLMAITRGHVNYIEEADYIFAERIIQHAAERLEQAVIPQSREVRVGWEIKQILPATTSELLQALAGKYSSVWVKRGIGFLVESEQVEVSKEGIYSARN
jgi:hypothetical protein